MKPSFTFHLDLTCTLSIEEIWPDGDAPEDPTVEDVERVFYDRGKWAQQACEDWDLLRVDERKILITKLVPRQRAQLTGREKDSDT